MVLLFGFILFQSGELICNKGIADDLMEIFYELYLNEYQIEKIRLVDEYQADDTASITDNNTSFWLHINNIIVYQKQKNQVFEIKILSE